MCYDHELRDLRDLYTEEQLENILRPIRCLPPLNIHEWCEHDKKHPEPSFKDLLPWR